MNDNKRKSISRVIIKGSIEDVWREVTKTGEIQKPMFNTVMHTKGLRPGAVIQMRTPNNKYVGIVGKVLEMDPPRFLSFTFKFTQYDDPECIVSYELREVAEGVEFTLTCDNLPVGTKTGKQMPSGGDMIANTLKDVIEKGKPSLGTRLLYVLFKIMEPFSPARTKAENWPLEPSGSSGEKHNEE